MNQCIIIKNIRLTRPFQPAPMIITLDGCFMERVVVVDILPFYGVDPQVCLSEKTDIGKDLNVVSERYNKIKENMPWLKLIQSEICKLKVYVENKTRIDKQCWRLVGFLMYFVLSNGEGYSESGFHEPSAAAAGHYAEEMLTTTVGGI